MPRGASGKPRAPLPRGFSMFLALLSLVASAGAADLTVDGTTLSLGGSQTYDNVYVINGGVIQVPAYAGTSSTGALTINALSITVDSTSSIVASGSGYRGQLNTNGEGPGPGTGGLLFRDSGGGGAHGGNGGNGVRDSSS